MRVPPRHPYPVMAAPFAIPHEPEPGVLAITPEAVVGIHLTFLRADGLGKADTWPQKKTIGRTVGVPIVVAAMNDNCGLAICEGVEDALSVRAAAGSGAWASGGASRMPALADAVPDYADLVTVVADSNNGGQRNAHKLAERLVRRGIAVDERRRPLKVLHDQAARCQRHLEGEGKEGLRRRIDADRRPYLVVHNDEAPSDDPELPLCLWKRSARARSPINLSRRASGVCVI